MHNLYLIFKTCRKKGDRILQVATLQIRNINPALILSNRAILKSVKNYKCFLDKREFTQERIITPTMSFSPSSMFQGIYYAEFS